MLIADYTFHLSLQLSDKFWMLIGNIVSFSDICLEVEQ